MICPECGKGIHMNWEREDYFMGSDNNDGYAILFGTCPVCNKFIVKLKHSLCVKWGSGPDNPGTIDEDFVDLDTIIYPNKVSRHDLDVTIPAKYSSVFREALALRLDDTSFEEGVVPVRRSLERIKTKNGYINRKIITKTPISIRDVQIPAPISSINVRYGTSRSSVRI